MIKSDIDTFKEVLRAYYTDEGAERVGFILKDDTIVEVMNIAGDPLIGFMVSGDDVMKYMDDAVATWHTHPNYTANLSGNDYTTFTNWDDYHHFIVGKDEVKCYKYNPEKAAVVEVE